ncbi:MAG TPA: glycosyltransferase family 2 protein [Beijerinckiaceae bacterium]|nr:glycosyltransferase family 2 protein [Beijerinckiaceae bacterium]
MTSPPQLTLVLPTYNERRNLAEVVKRVAAALEGLAWEVVIVDDDSPDGTAALAKEMAARDPRIRCLRRVHRRGLAGACIEGILSSSAPFVGVMDADLQHDETILPAMLSILTAGQADVVIGSRHAPGGSAKSGFSPARAGLSRLATILGQRAFRSEASDVMSGFFMMDRERFEKIAPALNSSGFKILADILASSPRDLRVAEVPYAFRARTAGDSKLDGKVLLDFLGLLLNKATGGLAPTRFVFFALVGGTGVVVHLIVLRLALETAGARFVVAETAATIVAMGSNFFVNNLVTYRDAKLKGLAILRGLLLFYAVCSFGALANIGLATWLFGILRVWWLAALAGVTMGSVWNYTLSSLFVWRDAW